jgi:hypothetical protein
VEARLIIGSVSIVEFMPTSSQHFTKLFMIGGIFFFVFEVRMIYGERDNIAQLFLELLGKSLHVLEHSYLICIKLVLKGTPRPDLKACVFMVSSPISRGLIFIRMIRSKRSSPSTM